MKEILLTQDKIALVDDEDFEKLNQLKWYVGCNGYHWYATRQRRKENGTWETITMHREILNAPKGILCDHKNGNGLDNRRDNLRPCTRQENARNRKFAQKNNRLGIKGVHWREDIKKFQSQIQVNGKKIKLGYFNILGDADSAYRIAEEKCFGEFARGKYLFSGGRGKPLRGQSKQARSDPRGIANDLNDTPAISI